MAKYSMSPLNSKLFGYLLHINYDGLTVTWAGLGEVIKKRKDFWAPIPDSLCHPNNSAVIFYDLEIASETSRRLILSYINLRTDAAWKALLDKAEVLRVTRHSRIKDSQN